MPERSTAVPGANEVVVVSCDGHVGPKLREQLRPYCPSAYLERFDDYVAGHERDLEAMRASPGSAEAILAEMFARHPNMATSGHHDVAARLADMDADGVAAEVMWHFSQNGEPLPWSGHGLGTVTAEQFALAAVGYGLYNRWLADFCSVEPERLLGVIYVPMWDMEATLAELRAGRERGLRVLNFPPPGRPGVAPYNDPVWEPLWSACEDLGVTLVTHSSGGPLFDYDSGPGGRPLLTYEGGGWLARRAVWWLTFGEVFERHPRLKLVITEQYEGWWLPTLRELDSVYTTFGVPEGARALPRLPSEYVRQQVFLGASFPSVTLVEEASAEGYVENVLWGRDYPHIEGIWRPLQPGDAEPVTKLALRHVLSHVPADHARMIAGENAIAVYGLDRAHLAGVAARIGALTAAEMATAPDELPDVDRSNAFIGQAGPRPLEPERLARLRVR